MAYLCSARYNYHLRIYVVVRGRRAGCSRERRSDRRSGQGQAMFILTVMGQQTSRTCRYWRSSTAISHSRSIWGASRLPLLIRSRPRSISSTGSTATTIFFIHSVSLKRPETSRPTTSDSVERAAMQCSEMRRMALQVTTPTSRLRRTANPGVFRCFSGTRLRLSSTVHSIRASLFMS